MSTKQYAGSRGGSWKQRSSDSRAGSSMAGSARMKASVLFLICLVLLGWFIWSIWAKHSSGHLVTAVMSEFGGKIAPSNNGARNDARAMRTLFPEDFRSQPLDNSSQDGASVERLALTLANVETRKKEWLVVYLSGHGISEAGRPYLIGSDFMEDQRQLSSVSADQLDRVDVAKMLANFDEHLQDKRVLLLLDGGRVFSDARIGMVANQFSELVEKEVAGLSSPNLFVLLSHATLETNQLLVGSKRTVFGTAVEQAMGSADEDENGFVDLRELYRYVYVFGQQNAINQNAALFQAGQGFIPMAEIPTGKDFFLVNLANIPKPDSEGEDEEKEKTEEHAGRLTFDLTPQYAGFLPLQNADEKTAAKGEKTAADSEKSKASDSKPSDSKPSDSKPSDSKASDSKASDSKAAKAGGDSGGTAESDEKSADVNKDEGPPTQAEEVRRLLERAWVLRDKLQQRDAVKWTPIDFAPHLWRSWNAELIHYELRALLEPEQYADDLKQKLSLSQIQSQLTTDLKQLNDLQAAIGSNSKRNVQSSETVTLKLLDAWSRFVDSDARKKLEEARSQSSAADNYLRYREAVYALADFVQLDAMLDTDPNLTRAIQNAIVSVASTQSELHKASQEALEGTDPTLRLLNFQVQKLESERASLMSSVEAKLDQALRADDPASRRLTAILGASPLLDSGQRKKLCDGLAAEKPLRADVELLVTQPASLPSASNSRWSKVWQHIGTEIQLLQLAVPPSDTRMSSLIADYGTVKNATGPNWPISDNIGRTLRAIYVDLPKIAAQPGSGSDEASLLCDRRDAQRLGIGLFAQLPLTVKRDPLVRLEKLPESLHLSMDGAETLLAELRANKRELTNPDIRITANSKFLEIGQVEKGNVAADSGQEGWFRRDIQWSIRPRPGADTAKEETAEITLRINYGNNQSVQHTVQVVLPRPDRVDLVVRRDGGSAQPMMLRDRNSLPLFPNHKTRFHLGLVNRFNREKKVKVTLFAINDVVQLAPGRIDKRVRDKVNTKDGLLNVRTIAETAQTVTLPAGDNPVWIDFSGAAPAGKDGTPPPPPKTAPAKSIDCSNGMVCRIVEEGGSGQPWIVWIPWRGLDPSEYVSADIRYYAATRQIAVKLNCKDFDRDGQPDFPTDGKPIAAEWDNSDPALDTGNFATKLNSAAESGSMAATVLENRKSTIRIAVDGFPRAFIAQVFAGKEDLSATERRRSTIKDVYVQQVAMSGWPRKYYRSAKPPQAKEPKEGEQAEIWVPITGQPCVFPPGTELTVRFSVDTPSDAYNTPDAHIQFRFDGTGKSFRFFADRQMTATVTATGADGLLEIDCTADDYQVKIPTGGFNAQGTLNVQARISVGEGHDDDRVKVLIDNDKPEIRLAESTISSSVEVGDKIEIKKLSVVDTFAVQSATVELSKKKEFKPDTLPVEIDQSEQLQVGALQIQKMSPGENRFFYRGKFSTEGLEPGQYLLIRVTDYVGNKSEVVQQVVTVKAPPEAKKKGPRPQTGPIKGFVVTGSGKEVKSRTFKVTIEGPDLNETVDYDKDAGFSWKDLKAGKYTLTAKGSIGSVGRVEGSVEVEVPKEGANVKIPVKKPESK